MLIKYYYFDDQMNVVDVPSNISLTKMKVLFGTKGLFRCIATKKTSYSQEYSEELVEDSCGKISHWGEREY